LLSPGPAIIESGKNDSVSAFTQKVELVAARSNGKLKKTDLENLDIKLLDLSRFLFFMAKIKICV